MIIHIYAYVRVYTQKNYRPLPKSEAIYGKPRKQDRKKDGLRDDVYDMLLTSGACVGGSLAAAPSDFSVGCAIVVVGLQSEYGKVLNGKHGRVGQFVEATGRYSVDLGIEKVTCLKGENLRKVAPEQAPVLTCAPCFTAQPCRTFVCPPLSPDSSAGPPKLTKFQALVQELKGAAIAGPPKYMKSRGQRSRRSQPSAQTSVKRTWRTRSARPRTRVCSMRSSYCWQRALTSTGSTIAGLPHSTLLVCTAN